MLHQNNREKNEFGQIVATIEQDYAVVFDLLSDLLAENLGMKISKSVLEAVEMVRALQGDNLDDGATALQVSARLRISEASGKRRLAQARDASLIENVSKSKRFKYRCTNEKIDTMPVLPTVEDVHESWWSRP